MPDLISQENERKSEKKFRGTWSSWQIVLFIIISCLLFAAILVSSNHSTQLFALFVLVVLVAAVIIYFVNGVISFTGGPKVLMHWAKKNNFIYHAKGETRIKKRLKENKKKHFLRRARTMPYIRKYFFEGISGNRKCWIFEAAIPVTEHFTVVEWCFEIETAPIKNYILATPKEFKQPDTLQLESREFEKKFRIYTDNSRDALQFFDPQMIELLIQNKIDAVECSESSIVFFNKQDRHFDQEYAHLDFLKEFAPKVAERIERNFPMSKYAKRPL